jgi:branched-chain amino acid transport system permease protein
LHTSVATNPALRSLWLATLCALAAGALFGWLVRSDALLSLLTQALIYAVLAVRRGGACCGRTAW